MLVFPTGWAKTIMIKTLYHYTTFISLKEKEISIFSNFIQCCFFLLRQLTDFPKLKYDDQENLDLEYKKVQ